jgi:hypothetical protein
MVTTSHPVDFAYTDQELQALFRDAHAHDAGNSADSPKPILRPLPVMSHDAEMIEV